MTNTTVLVAGGGIAGPAIALFLKRAGFQPVIFEAHAHVSDIGGGLQVAPNGMRVLAQLGLSAPLLKEGVESAEFSFENQFGKVLARIPNGPASRYVLPSIFISRAVLHVTLLHELERLEIPIHYSKRLRGVVSSGRSVTAEFTDGSYSEGSILIGADGIHSQTRRVLFPEASSPSYTGLMVLGGFSKDAALQPAHAKLQSRAHMIYGTNGFFGYGYHDAADPTAVMWWSHQQRKEEPSAGELRSANPEVLREQLIEQHRDWAEPVPTILRSSQRILWGPIYDVPDLETWSKDRVVLLGDAAHAISPHAGQGVSLGLEDAIYLAKCLRNAAYPDAFAAYQAGHKARVVKMIAEARKRGDAKQTLTPGAAKVRDFILAAFLRLRGRRMFDEAYDYATEWE